MSSKPAQIAGAVYHARLSILDALEDAYTIADGGALAIALSEADAGIVAAIRALIADHGIEPPENDWPPEEADA